MTVEEKEMDTRSTLSYWEQSKWWTDVFCWYLLKCTGGFISYHAGKGS